MAVTVLVSNLQVVPVRAEVQTQAADAAPVVSLEFEQVMNTGIGNLQFTDTYGTTAAAVTDSDGYQLTEREADDYLDLTGNKYLDVTKSDGTPLLTGQDSITILYKSYYQGEKSWAFYADSEDTANADAAKDSETSPNLNYFGITEAGTKVEKYGAGRASGEYNDLIQDPGSMVLNAPSVSKNTWKHIAVVIDHKEDGSETITLYQNGQVLGASSNDNATPLSEILGQDSIFRIGRANWGADGEYYDGCIDDFQVYGCALDADQITGKKARPQDQLLADFDFNTKDMESEKLTFTGGSAEATVENGDEGIWKAYGEEKALDLRSADKALYVTKKDGTPLLKGQETATIVFDSYMTGVNGYHYWPFYASKDVEPQDYNNQNYIGMCEIPGDTTAINRKIDRATGKTEVNLDTAKAVVPSKPITDQWKQVAVVLDRENTYFYVDGQLVDRHGAVNGLQNIPTIKEILGESGGIFQIGRANWGEGEFYNGMLDNFQIYAGALSEVEYMGLGSKKTTATVHVYEPDNKAYVLDYGLPVELNEEEEDRLGISKLEGADNRFSVSGSKLRITGVDATAEFFGFRPHKDQTDDWKYTKSAATEKSTLNWAELSVRYTPQVFMKDPDVYDYRVDVKKDLATDMDNLEATSADGVWMNGTLTFVPAEVVYYEDDFKLISKDGTYVEEGISRKLTQSNDQKGVYGYDKVYAGTSGNSGTNVSDEVKKDLLLHYDFSKISSAEDQTEIPDISGNEHVGTIRNHRAKVTGDVLTLPGGENTSDAAYIELPTEVFKNQEALTVSMWLKNETAREGVANDYVAMYVGVKVNAKDWPQKYWLLNPQNSYNRYKSVMTLGGFSAEKGFSPTSLNNSIEDTNSDGMKGIYTDSGWALYTTVFEGTELTAYYNGVKIGMVDTGISLTNLGEDLEAYIARSPFVDCHDDPYYKGGIRMVPGW